MHLLRERAQMFYNCLENTRTEFESVKDSPELIHYTHFRETLDSFMERLRSNRDVTRKIEYGLLDELDDPSGLRPRPWSASLIQANADALKAYAAANESRRDALITKVGSRTNGLDIVHGVLLNFSYNSLFVWDTLAHLNRVNNARENPFGFELAIFATPETLIKNFEYASLAIANR